MKQTPQKVARKCQNSLTEDTVLSSFMEAITKEACEVYFVVEREGKSHFTSCNIEPFYEMLRKSAGQFAQTFNDQLHAGVGKKPGKEMP